MMKKISVKSKGFETWKNSYIMLQQRLFLEKKQN